MLVLKEPFWLVWALKNILKQKIRELEHFKLKTKETSLVVRVPKYDAVLELTNSFA